MTWSLPPLRSPFKKSIKARLMLRRINNKIKREAVIERYLEKKTQKHETGFTFVV